MKQGIAGRIASFFIGSKLSLLLMFAFLLIGLYSTYLIPREEEPQIQVPIADILVAYPGASATEVESRITKPLEKIVTNITGIEHVYSTAMQDQAMLIAQFYVGEDVERSLVKLYNEIYKHMDQFPQGVSMPLIKSRSIDDVPALSLTLWGENYDDYQIRQITDELKQELKKIKTVAQVNAIGGRKRAFKVILDPAKLTAFDLDFMQVSNMLRGQNVQLTTGKVLQGNEEIIVSGGNFIRDETEIKQLVIGFYQQQPIYLRQVATIENGPEDPTQYVSFSYGGADKEKLTTQPSSYPAVTLAITKLQGADAMQTAEAVKARIEQLRKSLIPNDLEVSITRNYGETASEKVSELLAHLIGAIVAVTLVVMLAMGWRGGLVVFLSVPVTFALTLFAYYYLGYTLNRITLFALVFVTGIVVDDSIIIAENMHRHFQQRKAGFLEAALFAINEVGNPTILATFTVIASVLPMAFVGGLMGPYMSPMPIGASIAMLFSLIVALTITPYLGYRLLRKQASTSHGHATHDQAPTRIYRIYHKLVHPLLNSSVKRWGFLGITTVLLLASMMMFGIKGVAVKMLPFDNKNEFQVVIDMPEGTTLETTQAVTAEIGQYLRLRPEVVHFQSYVGTASPITFNGLVRHYDFRRGANVADIAVSLKHKDERDDQSHDIAKRLRSEIQKIGAKYEANIKLVEVPPGPPVLSTIVAEIYGPDYDEQIKLARQVETLFSATPDVVDVDSYVEKQQSRYHFRVDKVKAAQMGILSSELIQNMAQALGQRPIAQLYQPQAAEPIGMVLKLSNEEKSTIERIKQLPIKTKMGNTLTIGDLVSIEKTKQSQTIYRKNQQRVVYVLADMAGDLESPVYAILDISDRLKALELPTGYQLNELYNGQPTDEFDFTLKWDGEWQITYEVFRDLGIAFGVVLIFIYVLIVGWFENFKAPIVMMVAIPLSLIGIVLGHWLLDAYFTATSMIGFIALAGVMVRNSVLLIDFIQISMAAGNSLKEAIIEAGAVRTTPILLTAGTVVIGAFVILFDPIFQGLAISLMGGTIASTALTLIVVPLVYYMIERKK
ncbi:MAG: efflux RND transporter permease subunit [Flammeovirgaceae bacterium]